MDFGYYLNLLFQKVSTDPMHCGKSGPASLLPGKCGSPSSPFKLNIHCGETKVCLITARWGQKSRLPLWLLLTWWRGCGEGILLPLGSVENIFLETWAPWTPPQWGEVRISHYQRMRVEIKALHLAFADRARGGTLGLFCLFVCFLWRVSKAVIIKKFSFMQGWSFPGLWFKGSDYILVLLSRMNTPYHKFLRPVTPHCERLFLVLYLPWPHLKWYQEESPPWRQQFSQPISCWYIFPTNGAETNG